MTNPVISNNKRSNNPDYTPECEVQGDGTYRQVMKIAELPAGLATGALQTTGNESLASIDSKLTNPLPITSTPLATSSATEATASVTTSSSQILASNSSRKSGWIMNISDTTIYVSFGGTATTSSIPVFQYGTLPLSINGVNYTGAVNARHASSGSKTVFIQWC